MENPNTLKNSSFSNPESTRKKILRGEKEKRDLHMGNKTASQDQKVSVRLFHWQTWFTLPRCERSNTRATRKLLNGS